MGVVSGSREVRSVAAISEAGARTHAIVDTWVELSDRLSAHLGRQDATWPTFAGWAGASVGCLPRSEAPLGPALASQRTQVAADALEEVNAARALQGRSAVVPGALDGALEQVWRGAQQLVDDAHRTLFGALAPRLSGWVEALAEGPERADRFVKALPSSAPMLREALQSLGHAAAAEGPLRSELILLANDQLGLQQQSLLVGADARFGALDPAGAFRGAIEQVLAPDAAVSEAILDRASEQFALDLGHRVLELLATLARPHERARHVDAEAPPPRQRLLELDDELGLASLGPHPASGRPPEPLEQLRSRQQDPRWFTHPLQAER